MEKAACKLLRMEVDDFKKQYAKCLRMPDMHFKMLEADEKTRLSMLPKKVVTESREELKKIYVEWLGLQNEARKN